VQLLVANRAHVTVAVVGPITRMFTLPSVKLVVALRPEDPVA